MARLYEYKQIDYKDCKLKNAKAVSFSIDNDPLTISFYGEYNKTIYKITLSNDMLFELAKILAERKFNYGNKILRETEK